MFVVYPTGTCTCLVLKVLGDAFLISSPQNYAHITHVSLIIALMWAPVMHNQQVAF